MSLSTVLVSKWSKEIAQTQIAQKLAKGTQDICLNKPSLAAPAQHVRAKIASLGPPMHLLAFGARACYLSESSEVGVWLNYTVKG